MHIIKIIGGEKKMFYKITTTGNIVVAKEIDYWAVGLASVLLMLLLLGAFLAYKIGFTDAVTPLMNSFTVGIGGVFGAILGEGHG